MRPDSTILCAGEILWDALPAGLFLGGAPLNVALHLHALDHPVQMVSRIGDDVLGKEALRRIEQRGMSTNLVQRDDTHQTGFVRVELTNEGVPDYEIVEPVAWDFIELTSGLQEAAAAADVVVFGSLAQRNRVSRDTICSLLDTDLMGVFDVNLRPPHDTWPTVRASLQAATIVKMSEEELDPILRWAELHKASDPLAAFASHFSCDLLCITRGSNGALLWRDGQTHEHPGFSVEVADTVGVGDAFLAALLHGVLKGSDTEDLLPFANRVAAYVATQVGPTPSYDRSDLAQIDRKGAGAPDLQPRQ